jgi:hypothetical protein
MTDATQAAAAAAPNGAADPAPAPANPLAEAAAARAGAQNQPPAGAANQAAAGIQDGPKGYWPEAAPKDLSDRFRGVDDQHTIDRMLAEFQGMPRPPASAADYQIEFPKELAERYKDIGKDPALAVYREIAMANGLTQQQFNGMIGDLFTKMNEKGMLEKPLDLDAEIDALKPKGRGTNADKAIAAKQRIDAVHDRLNGLLANGTLTKEEHAFLYKPNAVAITAMEKVFAMTREHGLQGGGNGAGAVTLDEVKQRMKDPRYNSLNRQYDKSFRESTDALWRALNGA